MPTVAQFLKSLLENELRDEHKFGHWKTNETYGRTRVAPSPLGKMPLDLVTTTDVQRFIDAQKTLDGKPLAASTVRRIGALVSMLFSRAKSPRHGYIQYNPCDGVRYPQVRETLKRTLSPEEAAQLPMKAASPRLRAIVTLARDTGLRRGELCGLKWADLQKEKDGTGYIVIRQQIVRSQGGIAEDRPKTRTSYRREVVLTPQALAAIEEQPRRAEYIFTTDEGKPLRPDNLTRDFRQFTQKAGLTGLKLHGLRSSYISIMLEAGADVRTVQELVGHSSSRITQEVYARSRRDLKHRAAELFAGKIQSA